MNRNRTLLVAALVATPLALGACSSGSKHNTAPVHLPGVAASGNSGGSGAGAGAGAGWCTELKNAGDAILALGGNATDSPGVFKAKAEQLLADAPAEIKSDLTVLVRVNEKVAAGDTSAEAQLATPESAAKVQHVVQWISTNCKGLLTDLPSLPAGLPSP